VAAKLATANWWPTRWPGSWRNVTPVVATPAGSFVWVRCVCGIFIRVGAGPHPGKKERQIWPTPLHLYSYRAHKWAGRCGNDRGHISSHDPGHRVGHPSPQYQEYPVCFSRVSVPSFLLEHEGSLQLMVKKTVYVWIPAIEQSNRDFVPSAMPIMFFFFHRLFPRNVKQRMEKDVGKCTYVDMHNFFLLSDDVYKCLNDWIDELLYCRRWKIVVALCLQIF